MLNRIESSVAIDGGNLKLSEAEDINGAELLHHNISHRRKIGAFYTPLNVTTVLSEWGIRSKDDRILEPCFGGCTFLDAINARLQILGNVAPQGNLFGCDIDPLAFQYLKTRSDSVSDRTHFFMKDFMSFAPEELGEGGVDLVIGNPPYIRHNNFSESQRKALSSWQSLYGVKLGGRASLWAYFVMHALHFLKEGGRVAWVLPGSFLHAAYAKSIRDFISENFRGVVAVTVAERLFVSEGTEESTVVLLADGFKKQSLTSQMGVTCVDSVADLAQFVRGDTVWADLPAQTHAGHGMVSFDVATVHESLSQRPGIVALSELALVQIGLVTGDTQYFIRSKTEWKKLGVEKRHLRYILPRSQWVQGLELREADASRHIQDDIRCLALNSPVAPRSESLLRYLGSYPAVKRKGNATFAKRALWYRFFDEKYPDAFLVFMTNFGPRLILNQIAANATNSFYRVFFKKKITSHLKKIAAISLNSTFSQLSAEIVGHARGSGALKLEPSNALNIKLYMPLTKDEKETDECFLEIHQLLSSGEFDKARAAADGFMFEGTDVTQLIPALERGLVVARNRRIKRENHAKS